MLPPFPGWEREGVRVNRPLSRWEREGLSAVARSAKAEVRVKNALAELAPSGPCLPLDPFGVPVRRWTPLGGHIHCSKHMTRRDRPIAG